MNEADQRDGDPPEDEAAASRPTYPLGILAPIPPEAVAALEAKVERFQNEFYKALDNLLTLIAETKDRADRTRERRIGLQRLQRFPDDEEGNAPFFHTRALIKEIRDWEISQNFQPERYIALKLDAFIHVITTILQDIVGDPDSIDLEHALALAHRFALGLEACLDQYENAIFSTKNLTETPLGAYKKLALSIFVPA